MDQNDIVEKLAEHFMAAYITDHEATRQWLLDNDVSDPEGFIDTLMEILV